jgi:hypothetical protein
MKRLAISVLMVLIMIWLADWLSAGEMKIILPRETARLKPGAGAELVTAQCLLCHSADYISIQPRLSTNAWKAIVTKMRDKYGAPLVEDKIQTLADYLGSNYGNGK